MSMTEYTKQLSMIEYIKQLNMTEYTKQLNKEMETTTESRTKRVAVHQTV